MAKNYSNTSKNSQNGFYSSKEENQSKNRNSTSNSGFGIRIPVKILIQIRIRTAQTAIPKMQMTALAEKMIMMSQTDINRYCEQ